MSILSETKANIKDRIARHKERRMGTAKKKVLLLLLGGLSLGLSGSPRTSWKILGAMTKEWKELNKQAAERAINSLYASKLIGTGENPDGTFTLILNEKGKKKALTYNLSKMKVEKPAVWDRLWRIISFDIPENKKAIRDDIRERFLDMGFFELHDSVFIYPFDCAKEVEYISELYDVRKHIRFIIATYIDNEPHLKKFFRMNGASV